MFQIKNEKRENNDSRIGQIYIRDPRSNLRLFGQKQIRYMFRKKGSSEPFRITRRGFVSLTEAGIRDENAPRQIVQNILHHSHLMGNRINELIQNEDGNKIKDAEVFMSKIGFLKKLEEYADIPNIIGTEVGNRTQISIANYEFHKKFNSVENHRFTLYPDGVILAENTQEFWIEEYSETVEFDFYYYYGAAEAYLARLASKHIAMQMTGYPSIQIVPDGAVDRKGYKAYFKDFFERIGVHVPVLTISEGTALRRLMVSDIVVNNKLNLLQVTNQPVLEYLLKSVNQDPSLAENISTEFSPCTNQKWLKIFITVNQNNREQLIYEKNFLKEFNDRNPTKRINKNNLIDQLTERLENLPILSYTFEYNIHLPAWGDDIYAGPIEIIIGSNDRNRVCGALLRKKLIEPDLNFTTLFGLPSTIFLKDIGILMINHYLDELTTIVNEVRTQGKSQFSFAEFGSESLCGKIKQWIQKYSSEFQKNCNYGDHHYILV